MSKDTYVVYSLDQLNDEEPNVNQSGVLATFKLGLGKQTNKKLLKKAVKAIQIATDNEVDLIEHRISMDNKFMIIIAKSYEITEVFQVQQVLIKIK